jgi:hypothetical protein
LSTLLGISRAPHSVYFENIFSDKNQFLSALTRKSRSTLHKRRTSQSWRMLIYVSFHQKLDFFSELKMMLANFKCDECGGRVDICSKSKWGRCLSGWMHRSLTNRPRLLQVAKMRVFFFFFGGRSRQFRYESVTSVVFNISSNASVDAYFGQ